MTYALAFNRRFVGKAPYPAPEDFWNIYNGQFVNEQLEIDAIADAIRAGYGYTTWHAGYRKTENFVQGQHVALDFDTGDARSALDTLMSDPFIARHAAIVYTTPSHTPDAPRARVLFVLDRPIRDAEKYALLARALLWHYRAADESCKDPCRLFYGSLNCDMRVPANVLTLEAAAEIVAPYKAHVAAEEAARQAAREAARARYGDIQAGEEVRARYVARALEREYDAVAKAAPGARHKTLLEAAVRLGGFLRAAWVPTGAIDELRVTDTLLAACAVNGELSQYGEANCRATIRDGLGYASARDEPIWKQDEQGATVAAESSVLLPEIALTPEQAERERAAIERIRREAWWQGYHAGMSAAARDFWRGLGATDALINALQLGYDDEHDDLTIPYFNSAGELVNIEYRLAVDPADVCYETQTPALLHVKTGDSALPALLLPDALEAIRAARHGALGGYDVFALPHLSLDRASLAPLESRPAVLLAGSDSECQTATSRAVRIVRLPYSLPEMVRRGMTAKQIASYIRQAG